MTTKVIKTTSGFKVISDAGYSIKDKLLLKVKDTGNGYICRFPSRISCQQDNYVGLRYDEAIYLKQVLNQIEDL